MENKYSLGKNTLKLLLGIVVVIGVVLWLYLYSGKKENPPVETAEEAVEILSQNPQVQIETNPIKKVPDINPVEKINPFKTTNPFE